MQYTNYMIDLDMYMFHYYSIFNVFYIQTQNTCSWLPMVTIQSWQMPVATWIDH